MSMRMVLSDREVPSSQLVPSPCRQFMVGLTKIWSPVQQDELPAKDDDHNPGSANCHYTLHCQFKKLKVTRFNFIGLHTMRQAIEILKNCKILTFFLYFKEIEQNISLHAHISSETCTNDSIWCNMIVMMMMLRIISGLNMVQVTVERCYRSCKELTPRIIKGQHWTNKNLPWYIL